LSQKQQKTFGTICTQNKLRFVYHKILEHMGMQNFIKAALQKIFAFGPSQSPKYLTLVMARL